MAAQAATEAVTTAVLAIGSNDFNPGSSSAYFNIYFGLWSSAQIQSYANQTVANIETALATVRAAGMAVALVNVLDPGATPAAASLYTNGAYRDRVAAAIQKVNAGLKDLAQKYQVPLVDFYGLQKAIFGPNTSLKSTLTVGNVSIALRSSDPGPPNATPTAAFVSDGFHPNTVLQAMFANVVIQALNSAYGAGVPLFSEREMLSVAAIPYGGADTLLSQIGLYSSYVSLPALTRFTGIEVSNSNVTLSFSTVSNQLYILQSRDELTAGTWATLTNNLPGTGGIITLTYALSPPGPSRFFRIRQLP